MVRTEGLAPPITRARGERVSCYTTSGWCWQSGGGSSPALPPGQLISSPNLTLRSRLRNMVVSPGVAPGLPACRAGVVTGSLADEIGCQGRTRTCILPINNRPLVLACPPPACQIPAQLIDNTGRMPIYTGKIPLSSLQFLDLNHCNSTLD